MFFVFSKILQFLLAPLNWIAAFLLLGIFWPRPIWKKRFLFTGIALFFVFTNPLLINGVLWLYEYPPSSVEEIPDHQSAVVILGGYLKLSGNRPDDRLHLNEFPNRLINGLELYFAQKADRILLSGGIGTLFAQEFMEAEEVGMFLHDLSIPDSVVLLESSSRNTYENIRNTKELLQKEGLTEPVILVTSAFHMRRALAICQKQGLEVIPFSTDLLYQPPRWILQDWLFPDGGAPKVWGLLIKEWIGTIVYKLKGYA